jgi:CCR4-NOT transcription complex subunit 9
MSGLVSPKPVSYLQHAQQYNPYQRGMSAYSETPPIPAAPLAHPVPHQPGGQFMGSAMTANVGLHEDGKIYSLVIDLMHPNTREGALLELSKKREQYDDLALVLWHSFGACFQGSSVTQLTLFRRHNASSSPGNCLRVPTALAPKSHGTCIKPCV